MSEFIYAALDVDGTVLGVDPDLRRAVHIARDRGARGVPIAVDEVYEDPRENPPVTPERNLALAVKNCGLPVMSRREVFKMTPEDAYEILLPYLPKNKYEEGAWRHVKSYDTWRGARKTFLGGNFKMNKKPEGLERDALAIGLSLLPARHFVDHPDEHGIDFIPRIREKLVGMGPTRRSVMKETEVDPVPETFKTFCQGSSAACRESCLVITGQNEADAYNAQRKIAMTNALLQQPLAFVRILYEACYTLLKEPKDKIPFARLNVFSDIPWEVIAPFLFEDRDGRPLKAIHSPGGFYDYTKVFGRSPPENYDLTFSYSGEKDNVAAAARTLDGGGRVAVVFLVPGAKSDDRYDQPLPRKFWGYNVIDGDDYDMRTFDRDKDPCIIGLRWKPPQLKGTVVEEAAARAKETPFIIPYEEGAAEQHERYKMVSAFYVEEGKLVAPVTGRIHVNG